MSPFHRTLRLPVSPPFVGLRQASLTGKQASAWSRTPLRRAVSAWIPFRAQLRVSIELLNDSWPPRREGALRYHLLDPCPDRSVFARSRFVQRYSNDHGRPEVEFRPELVTSWARPNNSTALCLHLPVFNLITAGYLCSAAVTAKSSSSDPSPPAGLAHHYRHRWAHAFSATADCRHQTHKYLTTDLPPISVLHLPYTTVFVWRGERPCRGNRQCCASSGWCDWRMLPNAAHQQRIQQRRSPSDSFWMPQIGNFTPVLGALRKHQNTRKTLHYTKRPRSSQAICSPKECTRSHSISLRFEDPTLSYRSRRGTHYALLSLQVHRWRTFRHPCLWNLQVYTFTSKNVTELKPVLWCSCWTLSDHTAVILWYKAENQQ